jgi:hypothetical protein
MPERNGTMLNQGEQKTTIITYHGNTGRVTQQTVPGTTEKEEQTILPEEEEEQDSPFFKVSALERAIVKHVTRKVSEG